MKYWQLAWNTDNNGWTWVSHLIHPLYWLMIVEADQFPRAIVPHLPRDDIKQNHEFWGFCDWPSAISVPCFPASFWWWGKRDMSEATSECHCRTANTISELVIVIRFSPLGQGVWEQDLHGTTWTESLFVEFIPVSICYYMFMSHHWCIYIVTHQLNAINISPIPPIQSVCHQYQLGWN